MPPSASKELKMTVHDTLDELSNKPVYVPIDFLPEIAEHNDPLSVLLKAEQEGTFLFSEQNGPYANLYEGTHG